MRINSKTFLVIMALVSWVLYLGYQPLSNRDQETFPKPSSKENCLGYYYDKQEYRYKSIYKGPKTNVKISSRYHLEDNHNFTKKQAKDLEEYFESKQTSIDDIIDDLEYYLD